MRLIKLTNKNGFTRGQTYWGVGKTVTIDPSIIGHSLCTNQVLHAYESVEIAEIMDCIQGNYGRAKRFWEVEGTVVVNDGTKVGAKELTVVRELAASEVPVVTVVNRVAFGVLAALAVCKDVAFIAWANDWLAGTDRTARAAQAAARAAQAAARAAQAAWAARDAARAAQAAAWAAQAAAWAAQTAARDAAEGREYTKRINLPLIAKKCLSIT